MRRTDNFDDVASQAARNVRESYDIYSTIGESLEEKIQRLDREFVKEGVTMIASYLSSANHQLRTIRLLLWAITITLVFIAFIHH